MSARDADLTMENWLPGAQFRETHSVVIQGAPDAILDALVALDDREDALVRLMLKLREAPSRIWIALGGRSALAGHPRFGLKDFTLLERRDNVLAFGLTGRFWQLDFGLIPLATPEAFRTFLENGVAKLVMVYVVTPRGDGSVDLITKTHVHCPDRWSLFAFAPYWAAIRIGSGFIRRRILALVRRKIERSERAEIKAA
ncbi:MAG: hypothetical protein FWD68_21405 [Alphaproteobacteria bacterium]|nr:hypothetical protein [Alphaproteobacteria bacterium]